MSYLNTQLTKLAEAVAMEKQAMNLGGLMNYMRTMAHRGSLPHAMKQLAKRNKLATNRTILKRRTAKAKAEQYNNDTTKDLILPNIATDSSLQASLTAGRSPWARVPNTYSASDEGINWALNRPYTMHNRSELSLLLNDVPGAVSANTLRRLSTSPYIPYTHSRSAFEAGLKH